MAQALLKILFYFTLFLSQCLMRHWTNNGNLENYRKMACTDRYLTILLQCLERAQSKKSMAMHLYKLNTLPDVQTQRCGS